ncbi:Hydrogen peroxide-inducible genes activator [Nocardiopsis dassonvillei]|uniref:LysR family transcriptional regulator n=1 Tax=Nocardiopsis dassonvillei TaxID=2014 RepID=UPI003F57BF72
MMESRGIRALQAVAEHGTVTAAAAALNFTPSAVSQQIGRLSADLGVELLRQRGRRVEPTTAAHLLLHRAQEVNALWEEARAQVAGTAGTVHGMLRFCGVSSAIAAYIAPAASGLGRTHPGVETRIREEESEDCHRLLAAGESDIAVVLPTPDSPAVTDPRFEQRPLSDDPQDLLVPRDHPLAGRPGAELSEAASETWIVKRHGNDTYPLLTTACLSAGFTPRIVHEAKEWYAVSALVSEGLGVCLLPRMVPVPADHRVVRVPLTGPFAPSRRIMTCVRRGSARHPIVRAGLEALDAVVRDRR